MTLMKLYPKDKHRELPHTFNAAVDDLEPSFSYPGASFSATWKNNF